MKSSRTRLAGMLQQVVRGTSSTSSEGSTVADGNEKVNQDDNRKLRGNEILSRELQSSGHNHSGFEKDPVKAGGEATATALDNTKPAVQNVKFAATSSQSEQNHSLVCNEIETSTLLTKEMQTILSAEVASGIAEVTQWSEEGSTKYDTKETTDQTPSTCASF